MKTINRILALIMCAGSAMVGYNINIQAHSSCPLFWAFMDFFFWPCALVKWLICQQITFAIIKHTFAFFFN